MSATIAALLKMVAIVVVTPKELAINFSDQNDSFEEFRSENNSFGDITTTSIMRGRIQGILRLPPEIYQRSQKNDVLVLFLDILHFGIYFMR